MKPYCLASSSSGNCYILDFEIYGNHTLLMVECGIPYAEILHKCNDNKINLSDVKGCLITHAHKDHCLCAKDLNHRGIPIYTHKDTLEKINVKGNELTPNQPKLLLNGLCVIPFEVKHDIEGAVGFIIQTPTETTIFINDCKTWDENLINFTPDYVFIECNYEQDMVYAQYYESKKIIDNKQCYSLKEYYNAREIFNQRERQINSHMSLAGTLRNLGKIDLRKCKRIFLMHLSDRFANEYKMKNEIQARHKVETMVCLKKGGIK